MPGPWEPRIKAESEAVRDGVGVLDLPGFTRLRLVGPGARAHLACLTASKLPQPGRMGLIYFADHRGRIVTEMTCIPAMTTTSASSPPPSRKAMTPTFCARACPKACVLEDWTDRIHCFIVTGPKARDLLAGIAEADLTRPGSRSSSSRR